MQRRNLVTKSTVPAAARARVETPSPSSRQTATLGPGSGGSSSPPRRQTASIGSADSPGQRSRPTGTSGRQSATPMAGSSTSTVIVIKPSPDDGFVHDLEPDPRRTDGRKRKRTTNYTFRCKKCQEIFDSHEDCKMHFEEEHKHVCETCGKVYKQRYTLLVHNRRKHGLQTPPSLCYKDYIENIPMN